MKKLLAIFFILSLMLTMPGCVSVEFETDDVERYPRAKITFDYVNCRSKAEYGDNVKFQLMKNEQIIIYNEGPTFSYAGYHGHAFHIHNNAFEIDNSLPAYIYDTEVEFYAVITEEATVDITPVHYMDGKDYPSTSVTVYPGEIVEIVNIYNCWADEGEIEVFLPDYEYPYGDVMLFMRMDSMKSLRIYSVPKDK